MSDKTNADVIQQAYAAFGQGDIPALRAPMIRTLCTLRLCPLTHERPRSGLLGNSEGLKGMKGGLGSLPRSLDLFG
jgi:hypothetical protein